MLTGLEGPRIAAGLPTPWVGVHERISFAAFFAWLVVFAVAMLRTTQRSSDRRIGRPPE